MLRPWVYYSLGAACAVVLAASCTQDFDQFFTGPETITTTGTGNHAGTGGTGNHGGTNPGGGGSTGECDLPDDCGNANTCHPWTCVNHTCGSTDAPVDTACTGPGSETVCNGLGNCVECTQWGAGGNGGAGPGVTGCANPNICVNFLCVPLTCANGTQDPGESDIDCGGSVCPPCDVGQKCGGPTDCATLFCNTVPVQPICALCTGQGDCAPAGSYYCDTGSGNCVAKKPDGDGCTNGFECANGNCPAQDGVCCDTACAGTCDACTNGKTGLANGTCGPVTAGTDPDSECTDEGVASCGHSGMCDGASQCEFYATGTECLPTGCAAGHEVTVHGTCNAGHNCAGSQGQDCAPYVCNGNACYADCTSGPPACAANNYCDTVDDHCKPTKPDGQACPLGVECQHFCVAEPPGGSICCNTICNQECHACVTTKTGQTSGTCAIVTPGTDPDNECGSGGMGGAPNMCQGNGQCG